MHFNTMVISKLQAYVYALADPRETGPLKDRLFYIGKGKGNRCFNHAQAEKGLGEKPLQEGEHKLNKIRDIHRSGKDVEVLIVSHGMDDDQAHALEAVLIPLLGVTNKVAGHGDLQFWLTESQINEAFDRPIERRDIDLFRGNILFVSLNKQDTSELLREEQQENLSRATLGDWNVNFTNSKRVDCVVGVKNSLIVSIFELEKLNDGTTRFERFRAQKKGAHGRTRFYGAQRTDLEESLRGRSVKDAATTLSKIRRQSGCQFFAAIE